jgi:hypothetical protein
MEITKSKLKRIIKEELNTFQNISESTISRDSMERFASLDWKSLNSRQKDEIRALMVLAEIRTED